MRTIGNMVALKLVEDGNDNQLVLINDLNKIRKKAVVVAAGNRTPIKQGDNIVFNPEAADYYDYTSHTYFIGDFKISAIIR